MLLLSVSCFACQDDGNGVSPDTTRQLYYLASCSQDTIFDKADRWTNGTGEIFKRAEQMPRWFDCKDLSTTAEADECSSKAIKDFLDQNLITPEEAITNNASGVVTLQFVVDKEGCLQNINIVRDIGYGCGAAVQGAIAQMPKWDPGRQRGREVEVLYTLAYTF